MPARPKPAAMTADEFRAIIDASGLTQSDVAKVLGVSSGTVTRWANAEVPITAEKASLIRDRLGSERK